MRGTVTITYKETKGAPALRPWGQCLTRGPHLPLHAVYWRFATLRDDALLTVGRRARNVAHRLRVAILASCGIPASLQKSL